MKLNTVKLGLITLGLFAFSLTMSAQDKAPNFEKKFKKMDPNSDGNITLAEYKAIDRKNEVSDEKLESGFNKLDKNKDGNISLNEFVADAEKKAAKKAAKKDNE